MSNGRQLHIVTEEERKEAEEQIKTIQKEVDYDVRDFTIDYIVQQFQEGMFYIPAYQREYVWREHNKALFIESVILGLPIPFMFVADVEDGRLEVVDGAQRIQTLEEFVSGDLQLNGLEKLDQLNRFTFNDLPDAQQRKLKNRALRIIVLEDTTTKEIRYEIFKRINTTGEPARPSEIRRGAHAGAFMEFVTQCAQTPLLHKLCPISKSLIDRREYEELVVRFFAYSDRYHNFKHDVDKFLDKYVVEHNRKFDRARLEGEFRNMLEFVRLHFQNGFAKNERAKSTPRVRFEAISVGVNLALRKKPDLVPASMEWLKSEEFVKQTTTHASNSQTRLAARVEFVRDKLLNGR